MLWMITEFLVLFASKTKHGIHPGASVSLHLIICLVTAAAIGLTATTLSWYVAEGLGDVPDDDGWKEYHALLIIIQLIETLIAFMAILEIIHFILLVRACVETYQYNKWKLEHATRTVYVHVPVPYGYYMPAPGQEQIVFQPAPAQQQQQPQQPQRTTQGGPAAPAQAHFYGYYAPVQNTSQPAPQPRAASPPAETENVVAGSSR
jgi:hypothetical protein